MSRGRQDRGVSTVIGFILIFGIAITGWAVWQATAVPAQNEQTEFDHNQQVQGELLNVRDAALRTGTTGVEQSVTIQVGADYARRALGVNLAISSGRIRLRDTAPNNNNTLYIRGANATDAETRDYLNGTVTVATKSLEYQAKYGQYHSAPDTVIAGGLGAVINTKTDTDDTYNFSIGDQVLVSGRTITLLTFNGSLDEARGGESATLSLATEPLSVSKQSITVQNQSGPINLTIPTQIANASAWNQSGLESERTDGHVVTVTRLSSNYIRVLLESGTYSLRMLRVGMGSDTTDPGAHYITDVNTPSSVPDDSTTTLTYEVRDRYNNPVDGVQVNASILSGGGQALSVVGEDDTNDSVGDRVTANTSNGRVTFEYTAANVSSGYDIRVNVTMQDNSTARERVLSSFEVFNTDGSAGGDGGGGGGSGFIDGDGDGTGEQAACTTGVESDAKGAEGQDVITFDVVNNNSCGTITAEKFKITSNSDRNLDKISRDDGNKDPPNSELPHEVTIEPYSDGPIGYYNSPDPEKTGFLFSETLQLLNQSIEIGSNERVEVKFGYFYAKGQIKPQSNEAVDFKYTIVDEQSKSDYTFSIGFSDSSKASVHVKFNETNINT